MFETSLSRSYRRTLPRLPAPLERNSDVNVNVSFVPLKGGEVQFTVSKPSVSGTITFFDGRGSHPPTTLNPDSRADREWGLYTFIEAGGDGTDPGGSQDEETGETWESDSETTGDATGVSLLFGPFWFVCEIGWDLTLTSLSIKSEEIVISKDLHWRSYPVSDLGSYLLAPLVSESPKRIEFIPVRTTEWTY